MFNFASGVSVPFPEKIIEGYQILDKCLKCNISFEKLDPLLKDF